LVREKAEAGDISAVQEVDTDEEAPASATIHDLTEMLQRSLKAGTRTPAKDGSTAKKSTAKKSTAKKNTVKKAEGKKVARKPAAKKTATKLAAATKTAAKTGKS